MGKKVKKKARSGHKERKGSSVSSRSGASEHKNPSIDASRSDGLVGKEGNSCNHLSDSIDLDRIALKIGDVPKCEDCRDHCGSNKHAGKGKGKQSRKREIGSDDSSSKPKCIWVCLDCGHSACGGPAGERVPQSHALHHNRRTRHPCVVQFDNPLICWCFSCNSLIPVQSNEENQNSDDAWSKLQSLIKGRSMKVSPVDAEDVWFGCNVEDQKLENGDSLVSDRKGYMVRGLVNLGNTCFFNSVLQNVFAMDILRNYFTNLNRLVGPLTMALKKLFNETSPDVDSRNCLNPKSFFGCICSRAPQFRGYQQQDSHELLRYLLDGLSTEEVNAGKTGSSNEGESSSSVSPTFVDLSFGGQISSTVSCLECGHSSIVYEPFLDLSLPVPTKKPPSKKAPLSRTKNRAKPPLKEGKKGGKIRDGKKSNVASPLLVQSASKYACVPSEFAESSSELDSSGTSMKQVGTLADAEVLSWLDYVEVDKGPENSASQSCNVMYNEDSEKGQVFQSEDATELPRDGTSHNKEPKLEVECSLEKSREIELPLHAQDSKVLFLPFKEEDCKPEGTIETKEEHCKPEGAIETKGGSQDLVNSSVEVDVDFDGFGDLFNEPDIIVDPKSGSELNEEMEIALMTGNSSESNQDEVDNSNSQVTIDSCLALFTKSELLCDGHGWHCEGCSKSLKRQKMDDEDGKWKVDSKDNQLRKSKSWANGGVGCKNVQPTDHEDGLHTTQSESLDTGTMTSNIERFKDVASNVAESPLNPTGESSSITSELGQAEDMKALELMKPIYSRATQSSEAYSSDENVAESKHAPQVGRHLKSSIGDTKPSTINSTEENTSRGIGQTGEEVTLLSGQGDESDDSGAKEFDSESTKIRKDATKRILISKAPPILTIHLKRFGQDARGRLSKLSGHVSFGEVLDLRPYIDPRFRGNEKCWYHLVGVVEHSGTMRGGHYVAYVRGEKNKSEKGGQSSRWFYASDAFVREVSLTEVLQSEAYILFYEKI